MFPTSGWSRLLLLLLLLAVLAGIMPALAEDVAYPAATLSPDAPAYDSEHPENLEADQLYAWSAILIEADSGTVIFEKDAETLRHPASTTKIVTVLLGCLMVEDVNQIVTVSERAVMVEDEDSSTMGLTAGEEIPFIDVLYGAALQSGNDAANVIAEVVSGSIESFVVLMNQYVQTLGCENTHFNNPHGLTDPYHYTTAYDMALITRAAMENELFRQIVGTYSYSIAKTNITRAHTITNSNELLRVPTENNANSYYYPDAIGIKTGSTNAAQYCLVSAAERDGVELISVVLYSDRRRGRWQDTIRLFDYGFSQYTSVTPIDLYNMNPITLETSNYSLSDPDLGKLPLTCVAQDPAAASRARIVATFQEVEAMANNLRNTVIIEYARDFQAPIAAGEVIGTMTYFPEGQEEVVYNLVASRAIGARENAPRSLEQIIVDVQNDPNPFPPLSLELVVVHIVLPLAAIILVIRILLRLLRGRRHGPRTPRIVHRGLK